MQFSCIDRSLGLIVEVSFHPLWLCFGECLEGLGLSMVQDHVKLVVDLDQKYGKDKTLN